MPDTELIRSVAAAEVAGKRILVRADFDVSIKDGKILSDSRIRACVPTIELLQKKGAAHIVLIAHLGRPGGKVVEELRIAPVRARLGELIDMRNVELRENLRFDPREEANDPAFAEELAALGDVYVNEAFADSHREHASMVGVPKLLPSYAGLELLKEIEHLAPALTPPKRALAIIGGAKFETKEPLLRKLLALYPKVLLGGALANDLLKARGLPVGNSLVSNMPVPEELAAEERLIPPDDLVVELQSATPSGREAHTADVRIDERIVDIGTKTAREWGAQILQSEFLLWNGPTGVYEKGYIEGTDALAQALIGSSCKAVIGGGDTAAALAQFTFDPNRIFISTGGGAMLEFLAQGGTLPAIEALLS